MAKDASTKSIIKLGEARLASGGVLHDAQLGLRTWGKLNAAGDNAVILASYYSGTSASYAPWVEEGPSRIFDPSKYFVIAYDQLGAGNSSKPSTCDGGYETWPQVTCIDSVRAAHKAAIQLGVRHARLVAGWSMGGMQTLAWAATYPAFASAFFALCATPGCETQNEVFLRSIRPMLHLAATTSDADVRDKALKAFGAAYAGWAYSPAFFEGESMEQAGYASIANVMDGWADDHAAMDAQDLLAQLDCWLATAPAPLASTARRTRVLCMPSSTDRYFDANSTAAGRLYPGCQTQTLQSDLGHIAGRPGIRQAETAIIRKAIESLLVADDR